MPHSYFFIIWRYDRESKWVSDGIGCADSPKSKVVREFVVYYVWACEVHTFLPVCSYGRPGVVFCGVCPVALLVNYVVRVHELVCTNVCCVMGIVFFFHFWGGNMLVALAGA